MSIEIRIVIVDDSALFRILLRDILDSLPRVRVVGFAKNGIEALEQIEKHQPDLVTLDVEMPEMDGISTLRAIRERGWSTRVLMVSRHTAVGAAATTDALMEGAYDFILKPSGGIPSTNREQLKLELLEKIAADNRWSSSPPVRVLPSEKEPSDSRNSVAAVILATSTGGPEALRTILPELSANLSVPVLIVQHMPENFTRRLAHRLNELSALPVAEACAGDSLNAPQILIAPGGRQMGLQAIAGGDVEVVLSDEPAENGCRPAADYLLRSAVNVFGGELLIVVLTGMGADATAGCALAKQHGAYVIAQNEASSVVFGMPKSVIRNSLADEVVDLKLVAKRIQEVVALSNDLQ